ncbi:MAG TPA: glycosyltransferase family 2 protein [Proteobacteria bacterium]|nr:glycosyltransferase family 2 protein [Pseudomonadota bacterium]
MIIAALPAFNEEANIAQLVLKTQQYVDKVVVVDDGSTDMTAAIAERLGAHVVQHPKNKGYGAALRTCFETARKLDADVMVILDSDGQHDPAYIPQFLTALKESQADVVIGSRFLDKNHKNGIPKWRIVGMKVLDISTNLGGNMSVTDSQSGYRAYGRRAIEAIKIDNPDMGAGSEILLQIQEKQLQVAEIPINVRYDLENTSSKNPVRHGFGVLGSIVNVIAEKRPMLYIGLPGLVLIMIGFYFGLTLLRLYNQSGYFSLPYTLLAGFFVIVGVLGVFISLVLNVISRLLREREA